MFKEFIIESFTPPHNVTNCVSKDNKKRLQFIDLAKGICIILVILNHFDSVFFNLPNFRALRMPLYFVLSGLFFKDYDFKVFFSKKLNNIAIPFIFWLGMALMFGLFLDNEFRPRSFYEWTFTHELYSNFALWFLSCLFLTNAIFYILQHYLSGLALTFSVILCGAIGVLLGLFHIRGILWIDSSLSSIPFFYLGYKVKKMLLEIKMNNLKLAVIAITLIGCVYLIWYFLGENHIRLRTNEIVGNPFLIYINGTFLVIGTLLLCRIINWLPVVSYFGRYSIIPLCVHIPTLNFLDSLPLNIEPHARLASVLFGLFLICWLAIPVCKKIIPHFVAQKPLLKIQLNNKFAW